MLLLLLLLLMMMITMRRLWVLVVEPQRSTSITPSVTFSFSPKSLHSFPTHSLTNPPFYSPLPTNTPPTHSTSHPLIGILLTMTTTCNKKRIQFWTKEEFSSEGQWDHLKFKTMVDSRRRPHPTFHPPTNSSTHQFIHTSIHPPIIPSTHQFIRSPFHPPTNSSTHHSIHPLINSSTHQLIHSSFHPSTHQFIRSPIRSLVHSTITHHSHSVLQNHQNLTWCWDVGIWRNFLILVVCLGGMHDTRFVTFGAIVLTDGYYRWWSDECSREIPSRWTNRAGGLVESGVGMGWGVEVGWWGCELGFCRFYIGLLKVGWERQVLN